MLNSDRLRRGGGLGLWGRFVFERRADAPLDHTVADADQLQNRPACLRRPTAAWRAARCGCSRPADRQTAGRFLGTARRPPACRPATSMHAAAGGHRRGDRLRSTCAQRSLLRHFFHSSLPRSALVPNSPAASVATLCLAGQRDALLHQRPDFLGLADRGDDAALGLGLALSSNSASRSVRNSALARLFEQGALMAGIAAEHAAFSSMSHVCTDAWRGEIVVQMVLLRCGRITQR